MIIKNLTKKYNGRVVLDKINLELNDKGLVGISGESGSGKTTFLNALSLMEEGYEGEILIEGENILKFKGKKKDDYHLAIGYVFQTPYLFLNSSIYDNIHYFKMLKGGKEKEKEVINKIGLSLFKNKKVGKLSGGQKQRVQIGCLIASNPFLLLLDEPTSALDYKNSVKVMEIIKEESKKRLVIIVSHDKKLLEEYCDSLIYLKEGRMEKVELKKGEGEVKYQRKRRGINYFRFLITYAYQSLKENSKRSMLISFLSSIGLIGVLFSYLLCDGFTSFMVSELSRFQSNKMNFLYYMEEENLKTPGKEFEADFINYDKGYFYNYNFTSEEGVNKIEVKGFDTLLKFQNLGYIKRYPDFSFNDEEIGLSLTNEYLDYYLKIFAKSSFNLLNNHLKENKVYLNFSYNDSNVKLNFKLRLKNIHLNEDKYVSFIHSDPYFLTKYFKEYLTNDYEAEDKILIIPYLENVPKANLNELYLEDKYKKYDYILDNEIYKNNYTFILKSSFYRFSNKDLERLNKYTKEFFIPINKGVDMMGKFDKDLTFQVNNKNYEGSKFNYQAIDYEFDSPLDIGVSSELNKLLNDKKLFLLKNDKKVMLNVTKVIESNELIIYQNYSWLFEIFPKLLGYKEHLCYGASVVIANIDEDSLKKLQEEYLGFSFFAPLKEVEKETRGMMDKVKLVLTILSLCCSLVSLLLMSAIIFINTIEQRKIISLLSLSGVRSQDVIFIYLIESLFLAVLTYLISIVTALFLKEEINMVFNMMLNDNLNIVKMEGKIYLISFVLLVILSLISSLLPAYLASKKDSLKALKS